ncbi:hypothetical protein TIFTF001_004242 [Ficus carica]|uniref:Uncharacterized protein n=1 Tax=Ficus carica TaxID=3494 RepID=A0AA87ZH59_FICCA|nr:hypothetical protein TIFTF001_004242 [Ficus carica]
MPRGCGLRSSSPPGGPAPLEAFPSYPATTSASPNREGGRWGSSVRQAQIWEGGGGGGLNTGRLREGVKGSFFVGVVWRARKEVATVVERERRWVVGLVGQPTLSTTMPISLPNRDGDDGFPARANNGRRWRSLATDLELATWAMVAGLVCGRWAARARTGRGRRNA